MTEKPTTHKFYIKVLIAKHKEIQDLKRQIRNIEKFQCDIVKDWFGDVALNEDLQYPAAYNNTTTAFVDGVLWDVTIDEDCNLGIKRSANLFLNGDDLT